MNYIKFNKELLEWVEFNILNNCNKDDIFNILLNHNYNYDHICIVMNYYPINKSIIIRKYEQLNFKITNNIFTTKQYLDNPKIIPIRNNFLEIYKINNFLNDDECEYIIDNINNSKVIKSPLTREVDNDKNFRTSLTCYFHSSNKIIKNIDDKICSIMNIPINKGEGLQGQKYLVGNEFKKHTDYFDKNNDEQYLKNGGQRTWTFMVYLNEVETGGETQFTEINKIFKPELGMALLWNNLNNNGIENVYSMHWGMPVITGTKYIITKWFRKNII